MSDTCTEGNYTPGPWRRFKRRESQLGQARWQIEETTGSHPYWIAQVINEDDARLIASAPDLLEALKGAREELRLLRMKDTGSVYDPTLRVRIDAAIAKATGGGMSLPKHSTA